MCAGVWVFRKLLQQSNTRWRLWQAGVDSAGCRWLACVDDRCRTSHACLLDPRLLPVAGLQQLRGRVARDLGDLQDQLSAYLKVKATTSPPARLPGGSSSPACRWPAAVRGRVARDLGDLQDQLSSYLKVKATTSSVCQPRCTTPLACSCWYKVNTCCF